MENKKSALKAIRKGDEVVVISGSRKEKNGKKYIVNRSTRL